MQVQASTGTARLKGVLRKDTPPTEHRHVAVAQDDPAAGAGGLGRSADSSPPVGSALHTRAGPLAQRDHHRFLNQCSSILVIVQKESRPTANLKSSHIGKQRIWFQER